MKVYGLVNVPLRKVVDLYATATEADAALERVLANEPHWGADLEVYTLELETEEDGLRLHALGTELLDFSYREAPRAGEAEAPGSVDERRRRSTQRRADRRS